MKTRKKTCHQHFIEIYLWKIVRPLAKYYCVTHDYTEVVYWTMMKDESKDDNCYLKCKNGLMQMQLN